MEAVETIQSLYPQLGLSAVFLVIGGTIAFFLWRHIQWLHKHFEDKQEKQQEIYYNKLSERDNKLEKLTDKAIDAVTNNTVAINELQSTNKNLAELVQKSLINR